MNNIYSIMGLISTVFFSLPVIYILFSKMIAHQKFKVLFCYYLFAVISNALSLGYIPAEKQFIHYYGVIYNLLDLPLMLLFLPYFATTHKMKRVLKYVFAVCIAAEVLTVFFYGFTKKTITIISGPGLVLLFVLIVYLFLQQVQRIIKNSKANGKTLLSGSMLINYFIFILVYLLFYGFNVHIENGVPNKSVLDNIYLLYYTGTILSSSILCAGLVYESKRIRDLFDAKTVRKELAEIYKDENKGARVKPRTPFDDFDPAEFFKSNTYSQQS